MIRGVLTAGVPSAEEDKTSYNPGSKRLKLAPLEVATMLDISLLLLALALVAPSQPQQAQERDHAHQQAAERQSSPKPVPARQEGGSNSTYIDPHTCNEDQEPVVGWFESHLWVATWIMTAGTCAAAIVVAIYTCYAKKQVQAMTVALEFGNRAWISIVALDTEFPTHDGMRFSLRLKNSGKASAKGSVRLSLRQLPAGTSPAWEEESGLVPLPSGQANFFAPPEVSLKAAMYDFPRDLDWEGIQRGAISLWIMIQVTYDDIFATDRVLWAAARLTNDETGRPLWENPPPELIRFS